MMGPSSDSSKEGHIVKIGVLALQGAFEEHEKCLRAVGCTTVQVRTPRDLEGLDGIVLPGGESTAIGLIGKATRSSNNNGTTTSVSMWDALIDFAAIRKKPVWGTCAGMILLAEHCIGTSAVIENGQALIGGMDMTVCRNYFGSQISSFEMPTPPPPSSSSSSAVQPHNGNDGRPFPGIFIRAPAILSVNDTTAGIEILGRVTAVPCRQAAATLAELDRKIAAGENVIIQQMNDLSISTDRTTATTATTPPPRLPPTATTTTITLPGAAPGSTAREVICAARRDNLLCTAFHPELTNDLRWHSYFVNTMVKKQI